MWTLYLISVRSQIWNFSHFLTEHFVPAAQSPPVSACSQRLHFRSTYKISNLIIFPNLCMYQKMWNLVHYNELFSHSVIWIDFAPLFQPVFSLLHLQHTDKGQQDKLSAPQLSKVYMTQNWLKGCFPAHLHLAEPDVSVRVGECQIPSSG